MLDPRAHDLHPVAVAAVLYLAARWDRAQAEGVPCKYTFEPTELHALTQALAMLHESPELKPAVESLVKLAAHLDRDLGEREAASELLEVALTAVEPLERQRDSSIAAKEASTKQVKTTFKRMADVDDLHVAAHYGAPAPAGTIRISDLRPRRRIG
jgi:hypothetical protein